jgi:hypothetical protein
MKNPRSSLAYFGWFGFVCLGADSRPAHAFFHFGAAMQ